MRKELAPDARGALAATDATHILTKHFQDPAGPAVIHRATELNTRLSVLPFFGVFSG